MKYAQLFTLELFHDYYADRRCGDFKIEPTPETQKLLANCRCVLKPLPNGVRVLISVADQDVPFIPLPANANFAFRLRLQNPNFILFTDFSEIAPAAAPLFTNNGSNPGLQLVSREASETEHFSVRQPAKTDAFILGGRPLRGTPAAAFRVEGLGKVSQPVSYDETAKVIRVNSVNAKAGDSFTVSYPTAPELPQGVFADVEINMAGLAGGVHPFQIVFKAKKVRWKYYVVTNQSNQPAIEDKDKTITFNAAGPTDAADKIGSELAGQHPGMQTFWLSSNTPVVCQETARKSIQLKINGEKVMDALPNPAIQNFAVDATKEDSLYQIVKYFTQ